jgi:ssDNA-binding replication factor A large subunit
MSTTGTPAKMNIEDIHDGARNVNIDSFEVESISETRTVKTRFGTESFVAEAKISDATGETILSLWNDDIQVVSDAIGEAINNSVPCRFKITNGYCNSYRGEVKLNAGRYGTLEVLDSASDNKDADSKDSSK